MRSGEEQRQTLRAASEAIAQHAYFEPDRMVPACPGWTLGDLACHLASVQNWAAEIVETRPLVRPDRDESGPRDSNAGDWLRMATQRLDAVLATADPLASCWTFGPEKVVGFWSRRQAQEALIHHWDAVTAVDDEPEIAVDDAVEGVDEFVDVFVWRDGPKLWKGGHGTCLLAATDTARTWRVELARDSSMSVQRNGIGGQVTVEGLVGDLLLGLWGRRELDRLVWTGPDAQVLSWRKRLASMRL